MRWVFVLVCAAAVPATARSPEREVIPFAITWNVGFGSNVYVVGSHPDAGSWNPVSAVKLRFTAGNVWTGQMAVQKGTTLEYKYIARHGASNQYCNGANVLWEPGANRTHITASAHAPIYTGKTVYYYSSWTSAALVTADAQVFPLAVIGPGRVPGEFLYRGDGIGEEGEAVEFAMNGNFNGTNYWDNPPAGDGWGAPPGNYRTTLDVFLLRDGQVFNYWPSNTISAPRYEDRFVGSSFPFITGRTVRIWLPRGYDSHPWKRYPVIYMQDGQNMADPANPGGTGSWQFDLIAAREARQGRAREMILVGIDNIPTYRRTEYNPDGDTYPGEVPGIASHYLNYLVHNVRPTVDTHYRTLNDFRNTFVGGSSMGGIFSVFAGFETNIFSGVLAMSPAFTRAPNYRDGLKFKPRGPRKIYLDTGTSEGQVGTLPGGYYWDDPWNGYDSLLAIGYAPNEDLLMRIGCGHAHTESAWRARLPDAVRFLFDPRDEPNQLAIERWPPNLTGVGPGGETAFTTQQHYAYRLDTTTNLVEAAWAPGPATASQSAPWGTARLTNAPGPDHAVYRVTAMAAP